VNIERLKALIAKLPNVVTTEQFSQIELEMEDLLAQQRQAEEAELAAIQERAAELRQKLGLQLALKPNPVPRETRARGETDFENGVGDDEEETSARSFQAELASLRARGVAKRREH
jgi:hypothetical protein